MLRNRLCIIDGAQFASNDFDVCPPCRKRLRELDRQRYQAMGDAYRDRVAFRLLAEALGDDREPACD